MAKSRVYKVARSLGRGARRTQAGAKSFGSAFKTGVKRGYRQPKAPSSQTHLQKHWKKYAHGGGHVLLAGHAYSVGRKHGNPFRHRDDPKGIEKALNRMNKKVNKYINKKLQEKERR